LVVPVRLRQRAPPALSFRPVNEDEYQDLRRSGKVIYILGRTVMFRRHDALAVGGYDPRFYSASESLDQK
jgi:hypothetical protein